MSKAEKIQAFIEPAINALGLDLWGVELLPQGQKSLLRIYIDKVDGVNVDDCSRVSHQVSGILDVEEPISSEYVLEVSSPGMNRPLFKLSQFVGYVGEMLSIRLSYAFEGRKKFRGQLVGVEGDEIVLRIDDEEYLLPFDAIDKANLVFRD